MHSSLQSNVTHALTRDVPFINPNLTYLELLNIISSLEYSRTPKEFIPSTSMVVLYDNQVFRCITTDVILNTYSTQRALDVINHETLNDQSDNEWYEQEDQRSIQDLSYSAAGFISNKDTIQTALIKLRVSP